MDLNRDSLPPELAARERDPRPVTLILIALGLIAAAVAMLISAGRVEKAKGLVNRPTSFSAPAIREESSGSQGIVTDTGTILAIQDPSALRGAQVALIDVQVQSVPGDYTFWVGENRETEVPVLLLGEVAARQSDLRTRIRPGQVVRVFGILRLVHGAIVFDEDRLLSEEERERLRSSKLYVDALRVQVVREPEGK